MTMLTSIIEPRWLRRTAGARSWGGDGR